MRICIDEYVVQFSKITKEWHSDLISLKDLLIGMVLMWFDSNTKYPSIWLRNGSKIFERNYNESLAMSLLEILCYSRSSCSLCVLRVLRVFFFFKGLWWKFFGALEAWIRRASLIYGLLRFLEDFELDSSKP